MKVCFYTGSNEDSIFNRINQRVIEAATGKYCHTEIMFSDGICFSSIVDTGPRLASLDLDREEGWDFIDIPCTVDDECIVRRLAEMITRLPDKHYGWSNIWGGFLPVPLTFSDPTAWICSASVTAALQSIGLMLGFIPQQTSPTEVFDGLTAQLSTWQATRFSVTEGA